MVTTDWSGFNHILGGGGGGVGGKEEGFFPPGLPSQGSQSNQQRCLPSELFTKGLFQHWDNVIIANLNLDRVQLLPCCATGR